MQGKLTRYGLLGIAALILIAGAFSGGVLLGWAIPNQTFARAPLLTAPSDLIGATPAGSQESTEQLFKPFWQAWQIVHDQYVEQPVNDVELMRGAIRGMLAALGDQHTSYMDPEQYQQANAPLKGEYEGIGAWVDTSSAYLTIVSPMPGSPAEKAGLKPGDQIIAIDGEDMTGIDGSLALRRVLGPAGTKVRLTIHRESQAESFEVIIERAKIVLPSATGKMLENNLAYVQLLTFGENTMPELTAALKELMAQHPKGMILDLRDNGGGYLETAVDALSEFFDENRVVMYEQYGDGRLQEYKTKRGGLAGDIPLVVLVNQGTASASEIMAGAIQDLGRGKLVGTTTYGKGSVQNWIPLADNAGAVRITIARWLTPSQRQIHGVGLKPDVEVPLTEEDFLAGRDPQLEKAIELLTNLGQ